MGGLGPYADGEDMSRVFCFVASGKESGFADVTPNSKITIIGKVIGSKGSDSAMTIIVEDAHFSKTLVAAQATSPTTPRKVK